MIGIWKNKKNEKNYEVVNVVINATNNHDGQLMVLYKRCVDDDDDIGNVTYVREREEFFKKFEYVGM